MEINLHQSGCLGNSLHLAVVGSTNESLFLLHHDALEMSHLLIDQSTYHYVGMLQCSNQETATGKGLGGGRREER